jgi:DNA-binding LytR/AlgR family response regulator
MSERSSLMPGDRDSAVRNESRLMRYQLEYRLVPPDSSASSEAGTACLLEDALEIQGDSGRTMPVPLRDIVFIETENYRIGLYLKSGAFLELYYLGHHFRDLTEKLIRARNEVIKKIS